MPLEFPCILILVSRVDKKFFRPATIRKWVVVVYESEHKFNRQSLERSIGDMMRAARAAGTLLVENLLY